MSPDNSRAWKAAMVDGLIDRMTRRVEGIVSVACDRELGDETDLHVCAHADAWSTTISVRVFTRQELNEVLVYHTGQPLERIEKDTERDFYMRPQEAKEYGLVDDVLEGQPAGEDEDDDED